MAEFPLVISASAETLERLFSRIKSSAPSAGRAIDKVSERAQKSATATARASKSTDQLSKSQQAAAQASRSSSRETGRLKSRIDQLHRSTQKQTGSTDRMTGAIKRAGVQFGIMIAGALSLHQAISQVRTSIDTFQQFELRVAGVRAVSGETTEAMARLEAQARDLGRTTMHTAVQAAEAQESLAKAGFETVENLSALPEVLNLATVAEVDMATAADIAAGALRGFQIPASQAQIVTDVLAKSTNIANTGIVEMSEGLKFAAPIASQLGVDIKDTSAALGVLADNMLKGTLGGTSLRTGLLKLIDPTGKAGEVLEALNVSADEFQTTLRDEGLVEALRLLQGGDIKSAVRIAGLRGGPGLSILLENLDELASKREDLEDIVGVGQQMADIKMDTLFGDIRELNSAVDDLRIAFGEGLSPQLRTTLDDLTEFFQGGTTRSERFGSTVGKVFDAVARGLVVVAENFDIVTAAVTALLVRAVAQQILKLGTATLAWAAAMHTLAAGETAATVATVGFSLAVERLKIALLTNPVTALATALGILAGTIFLVRSRTRDAAEAQQEYNDRLRFGTPEVQSAVEAHEELIGKLEREIEARERLLDLQGESQTRLEQLRPILENATAAAQAGDLAGYREAIAAAEDLGVALREGAQGSKLQQLRLEIEALAAEAERAETGIAQSTLAISSVQDELTRSVEDTIDAEIRLRAESRARLAETEANAARLNAELARSTDEVGPRGMGGADLAGLRSELQESAEQARMLADEVARANERLLALSGRAGERIDDLISEGDFSGLERFLELLQETELTTDLGQQTTIFESLFGDQTPEQIIAFQKAIQDAFDLEKKRLSTAPAGGAPDAQQQKFDKLTESLRRQRDEALALADAYDIQDEAAQRSAIARLEAERKFAEITKDLTAEQIEKLRELGLVAQVSQAERQAAGAKTIDTLRQQVESQLAVNVAHRQGSEAVEKARRAQELHEEQMRQTEGAADDKAQTIEDLVRQLFDLRHEQEALARDDALREQIDDLERLASAYEEGIVQGEGIAAALEVERAIREELKGAIDEEREGLSEQLATREKLAATIEASKIVEQLEDELEHTEKLSKIRREDFLTESSYQDAIAGVNLQKQIRNELLAIEAQRMAAVAAIKADESLTEQQEAEAIAEANRQFAELARRAAEASRQRANLEREMEREGGASVMEQWVDAADLLADALRGVDDDLANIVSAAADAADAFSRMGEEGGKINAAVAGFQALGAVGEAVTGPKNYAAEGGAIGAIVGAIIGAFTPVGPAGGAAIGGAAGSALGSFINKGSDEFLAEVNTSIDGTLSTLETKVEGSLGGQGSRFVSSIEAGIEKALDAIGGELVSGDRIQVKVRDGVYSVFVNGLVGRFQSMNEAVDFAITQFLRTATIEGISPEVQAALQNTTAETFQQLADALDFARWVESLPEVGEDASQAAVNISALVDEYHSALRQAAELGIERGKIDQWFVASLERERDVLLGITETAEERIRREAEAYNRELRLVEAEEAMRLADLQSQAYYLEETARIALAELGLSDAQIDAELAALRIRGEITQAYGQLADASLAELSALWQAIEVSESILEGIGDLYIDDSEIQDAINRAGSGAAEQRQREREQIEQELQDINDQFLGMSEGAIRLRGQFSAFDDWIEKARELGFEEERLAEARRQNVELETSDFLSPFQNIIQASGETDLETELRGLGRRLNEAMSEALVIAEERAEAFGTTIESEMAAIAPIIRQALGIEAARAIQDSLVSAVEAGDLEAIAGISDALDQLPADIASEALRELGSSAEEMRSSILEVRDSIMETVQDWTDAVLGIGDFERKLLDLQSTFSDARNGLEAVGAGLNFLEDLPEGGEPSGPTALPTPVAQQVQAFEDSVGEALERLADAADEILPQDDTPRAPRIPETDRPGGIMERSTAAVSSLEQAPIALSDTGDAAEELAEDLDLLEAAERRAIQALGVDFIGSLKDLGVSLPTGLTLELAQAQFHLARSEAISSAIALAAAGGFDELSISLGDVLDMISGASFEASRFAPQRPDESGGRSRTSRTSGGGTDLERRIEERLRAWDRALLGGAARQAAELAESLIQVRSEAEAAGFSLDRVSESYRNAVSAFVDDSLEPFENLELSDLERDLGDLQDRFVDLLVAFETAGADAEQMARLQDAFSTAMEDFWDQATAGIRRLIDELRAEDPRVTPAAGLQAAQERFRGLLERAQGGDLEAIEQLEEAARLYRDESLSFLGGGVGTNVILDEILAGLEGVEDLELLPEDIEVLRDQAESLLDLIDLAEAQATDTGNRSGFSSVRRAVEGLGESNGNFLAELLQHLQAGELTVDGIGDVLSVLGEMVSVADLSETQLQSILDTVGGVVQTADELAPDQLNNLVSLLATLADVESLTDAQRTQLDGMIASLLDLETLSDEQRNLLLGIDTTGDGQARTMEDILTSSEDTLHKISAQNVFLEPLNRSMNVRLGDIRVTLYDIRDLLAAMPSMQSGGSVTGDGFVYLHAGERVLSPQETAAFDRAAMSTRQSTTDQSRPTTFSARSTTAIRVPRGTSPDLQSEAAERLALSLERAADRPERSEEESADEAELRRSLERESRRRAKAERTAAKLAAARVRQGSGELELLEELRAEVAALRRDARRKDLTAGRSR